MRAMLPAAQADAAAVTLTTSGSHHGRTEEGGEVPARFCPRWRMCLYGACSLRNKECLSLQRTQPQPAQPASRLAAASPASPSSRQAVNQQSASGAARILQARSLLQLYSCREYLVVLVQ